MRALHVPTLMECEESPVEFFKALGVYQIHSSSVSFEPRAHQSEVMNKAKAGKSLFISKPRQVGMTASLVMYALWKAIFRPGTQILFVTARSSQLPLKSIYQTFLNSKIPYINKIAKLIKIHRKDLVAFENGSSIHLASSRSFVSALSGAELDIVIFDEFDWYKQQNQIYMSTMPMIASGGGQMIMASTPNDRAESDLFKNKVIDHKSSSHNTLRVLYSQNRYIRHSLNNRYPFTLGESGFFGGEENLKDLVYNNWFPLEELTENDYFHFY